MSTPKLKKGFKKKWVKALRSGKYTQGKMQLLHGGRYCCWGVACDLLDAPELRGERLPSFPTTSQMFDQRTTRNYGSPLRHIQVEIEGAYKTLQYHNDGGKTFAQIADAIEEQL